MSLELESRTATLGEIPRVLYACISGPASAPRDWNRFRSLFAPNGRLIALKTTPSGGSEPEIFDVEAYIRSRSSFFLENGLYETELTSRVERWQNAAHILSSYEARREPSLAPFLRGVNSIQLYNDGRRWWILSIVWDNGPGAPCPPRP